MLGSAVVGADGAVDCATVDSGDDGRALAGVAVGALAIGDGGVADVSADGRRDPTASGASDAGGRCVADARVEGSAAGGLVSAGGFVPETLVSDAGGFRVGGFDVAGGLVGGFDVGG